MLLFWFLYVWNVFFKISYTLDFALIILLPIRSFYNAKLKSCSYDFMPLKFLLDKFLRYLIFVRKLVDPSFGLFSYFLLTSRLFIWFYLLKKVLPRVFLALVSGREGVFWKFYVMSLSLLGFMILCTRSWLVILNWYSSVMCGNIFLIVLLPLWCRDLESLEVWCWL